MNKIPHRAFIGMMVFLTTFVNYMFRSHFQISLLAMIKSSPNGTDPDYGPRFDWDKQAEQQTIAALFYGITVIALPSGLLSEWLGPWNILFYSTIGCGVFSSLIVPAAHFTSWIGVLICRFFVGMFVALQYPALQCLVGRWAPPAEKGKFSSCFLGNVLGTMLTLPLMGVIAESFGWNWSFYSLNVVVVIYCAMLWFLVADYPEEYRYITKEELQFIKDKQGDTVSNVKTAPPYLKMMTSVPFIALIIAQFANQYGLFMQLTAVPQFMSKAMKFNLRKAGLISALPSVTRLIFGFIFGCASDFLQQKGVKKNYVRKGFTIFSHILCGATLYLYFLVGTNTAAAVAILVMMMVFNGAAVATVLLNPQDLAPNWAGSQYGITNFFGGWGGFIGPMIIAAITDNNTMVEWAAIFSIGGTIYIVAGIFFIIYGSTELQPWNEKKAPQALPTVPPSA